VAISTRAIESAADGRADILPLEESEVTKVSDALTIARRPPVAESDSDKLSDALFA
jgi:hypothetical protein